MRIAVVDDEHEYCKELDMLIERWKRETGHRELILDYFDSAEKLLFRLDSVLYDLYLLDIRLPNMNGYDLGKMIRCHNEDVTIAFITNDEGFIEKGYEIMIFRYIRKPLLYDKLRECLDYAWQESENKGKALIIRNRDMHMKILYKNITFFSSGIHNIIVHTKDRRQFSMSIKTSIDEFLKQIQDPSFIRVHRGFIVNMQYVDSFTRNEIRLYTDPDPIPIGKKYHDETIGCLKRYFFAQII